MNNMTYTSNIPQIFIQTGINPIDINILNMIRKKLGSNWKYEFYNDEDITNFFINNPIEELPDIISKFNSITKGPHKADLFRYYYLYLNGGMYMDTDAMIHENIENIIQGHQISKIQKILWSMF